MVNMKYNVQEYCTTTTATTLKTINTFDKLHYIH